MVKQTNLPNFYPRFAIWAIKTLINFLFYFGSQMKGLNKSKVFFIVQGDTVSTLIGAIIGRIFGMKLVHIESGLRSFNFLEPFPEELSRFIISKLAVVHFCPNDWSSNNLKHYRGTKITTGQNTLYESCQQALQVKVDSKYLKKVGQKKYFLFVLHRQEHLLYKKGVAKKYIKILTSVANADLKCIFVLHKLTEGFLKNQGLLDAIIKNPHIITVPRLPYFEFVKILSQSEFIATDGGSNQEEAYYLGKPCLILRNVTERIEGLKENAILAKGIDSAVKDFLKNYKKFRRNKLKSSISPSKIISDYLNIT